MGGAAKGIEKKFKTAEGKGACKNTTAALDDMKLKMCAHFDLTCERRAGKSLTLYDWICLQYPLKIGANPYTIPQQKGVYLNGRSTTPFDLLDTL